MDISRFISHLLRVSWVGGSICSTHFLLFPHTRAAGKAGKGNKEKQKNMTRRKIGKQAGNNFFSDKGEKNKRGENTRRKIGKQAGDKKFSENKEEKGLRGENTRRKKGNGKSFPGRIRYLSWS